MIVGYCHHGHRFHSRHGCPHARRIAFMTIAPRELAIAAGRAECDWCRAHPEAGALIERGV